MNSLPISRRTLLQATGAAASALGGHAPAGAAAVAVAGTGGSVLAVSPLHATRTRAIAAKRGRRATTGEL